MGEGETGVCVCVGVCVRERERETDRERESSQSFISRGEERKLQHYDGNRDGGKKDKILI